MPKPRRFWRATPRRSTACKKVQGSMFKVQGLQPCLFARLPQAMGTLSPMLNTGMI